MKIYTKTGDKGTTSLVGGKRVQKNDRRLDAYGTVDELNAWLGFVVSQGVDNETSDRLIWIQHRLFDIGCLLASEKADDDSAMIHLPEKSVEFLENSIDTMESALPKHKHFILPGGNSASTASGIARTVCRRAERHIVSLPADSCPQQLECLQFINRLSDFLFVLSRYLNVMTGTAETFWKPE